MIRPDLRLRVLLACLLVFAGAAFLIKPIFNTKYLTSWQSIESTFIADARFLSDHWPHPGWQPNWYCGTRTDYIYPPALRYGTAALIRAVPKLLPVRAYHIYIGFFYCFGIAAVCAFVGWCSRSSLAGAVAAAATALISPGYLFNAPIRDDAPFLLPYRLNVLVRYGEGPHMTALAWIPLALLFSFRALERWRPVSFALASFCCAMVALTNFYGATALALLYPLLVWSIYVTHQDRRIWMRAALIPVLTWGLTAFWLTPSYFRITLHNMQYVSQKGNMLSVWLTLLLIAAIIGLSLKFARGRRDAAYVTFVASTAALFTLICAGHYYFNFRILGEPPRLFPEFDLVIILLGVELLRRLWFSGCAWMRGLALAATLVALWPAWNYLSNSRFLYMRDENPTARVEYQLQDWIATHMPQSRVFAAGSVRFWYNVWHDLPQLGGGSDQGILNPHVVPPIWAILLDKDAEISTLWMQLMGVDAVIVNGKNSQENYKDFAFPDKLAGVLRVLHDNGRDDRIYRIPRRFSSIARVVDRQRHVDLPEIRNSQDVDSLRQWRDVIENGPDVPAEVQWDGTDAMRVRATISEGQRLVVQESFDPNWHAESAGKPVPIQADKLGFMALDLPPGQHEIQLRFAVPLENMGGRFLSAASACCVLVLLIRRKAT